MSDDREADSRRAGRYDRHRSRSPQRRYDSSSSNSNTPGGGGDRYARTESTYGPPRGYPNNMQQQPMMYPNAFYPSPQQQQQQQHGGMMAMGFPPQSAAVGGGGGMNPAQLLQFLQQQRPPQQPLSVGQQHQPHSAPPANTAAEVVVHDGPLAKDFIPTVPKSLLNLLQASKGNNSCGETAGDGQENPNSVNSNDNMNTSALAGESGAGVLMLLGAPKIAPEVERQARESRRAHISGFPLTATEDSLTDFFRLIMPDVRRIKTQREVRELALAAGDSEEEVRQIPANAQVEVDQVWHMQLRQAKSKLFAFVEVNMADLISEMVEESEKDPERFIYHDATGRGYPILVRRPRDFQPLEGGDESRVVMTGFHPSLPEDKLRAAMEQFGTLDKFDAKNGLAYAEFANPKDATDCRTDLHGEVLGQKMVIVLTLYNWLACVCNNAGIDVTVNDDDPISGTYALNHGMRAGGGGGLDADGGAFNSNNNNKIGGGAGNANAYSNSGALVPTSSSAAGGGGSNALVLSSATDAPDPMKDLLAMAHSLPEVITRLVSVYPHLRPLYGNQQVPIYATRVLALLNLFDEDELVLDSTYSRLLEEIEGEVEKYGRVEELIVPRREARPKVPDAPKKEFFAEEENPDAAFAAAQEAYLEEKNAFVAALDVFMDRQLHPIYGGYGRVFVVYETVDEAALAQQQIAGKLFGGRTVVTSFVFEDLLMEDATFDDEAAEALGKEEEDEAEGQLASGSDAGKPEKEAGADVPTTEKEEEPLKDEDTEAMIEDLD